MLLRATLIAAAIALLSFAALAHADDTLFINVLDKEGVEYSSPTNAKVVGPQAKADDNCVARSIGSLCRNPDNSLMYCGVGPLSTCTTIRPD
jgi:hypothetical protein